MLDRWTFCPGLTGALHYTVAPRNDRGDISPLRDEIPFYLVNTAPIQTDELTLQPGNPEVVALAEADATILPITQEDVLREQQGEPYCRTMMNDVGKAGTQFEVNRHSLLFRRAPLHGSIQIVIPASLRALFS